MLQRLLIITLTLCSLTASAQWQQTGSKVRYVNGLGIPTKDTAAGVAADSSQILIRPADSSLYIKYKRTWVKVGAGGGGTIGGSGTINRVPKFTASTTLGNSSIADSASAVAMTINSLGNVGIGTASPQYKLNVNGSVNAGLDSSNLGVLISPLISSFPASSIQSQIGSTNSTFGFSAGSLLLQPRTGVSASMIFGTEGTAKMVVTSTGNALIGTTTDNGVDKLQVSGSAIASTLKVNTSGQTTTISNYYNTGGGRNIWIGGGGLSSTSADENTAVGYESMLSNTSGYYNAAIGSQSLRLNTTGYYNMAFGMQALASNTSGYKNTAIGTQSLGSNTTGNDNLGIGAQVLGNHTNGNKNNGIGSTSLFYLTSGSSNIALGYYAGLYINGGSNHTTANQSIFIGEDTRASANGNTNEMVFGHTAIGQGSNTVTLGNSSITKTFLRGNTMVNTTTDNGVDELQVQGSISGIGFKQAYVTKTGAYTATNDDYVIDCTSGTFTVTLPASSGRTGRILIIKNSGAGTITVDGNASETIDGAATYSLSVQYATVQIMSDGTNWKIIAKF
jgi:hypothetical protein